MLIATHITFVFMVPIMLLNFLIGLMSTEIADHLKNRDLCVCLARVASASLVEERMGRILSFFYKRYRKSFYVVHKDRVYVECLVDS